jgi:hypothetical protein
MNSPAARILIPIAVIVVLNMAGIIDLSLLPWETPDFQATLATVVIYLIWSVAESSATADASRITLYAVLLVSVLDAFLLRLTAFSGYMAFRWAGAALLAAGCLLRAAARRRGRADHASHGRIAQMLGLALGLGSLAGTAVALFPGIPSALKESKS